MESLNCLSDSSAFVILTNEESGNMIWYFKHSESDTKVTREMGVNNNTSMYIHEISNADVRRWVNQDIKNGYDIAYGNDEWISYAVSRKAYVTRELAKFDKEWTDEERDRLAIAMKQSVVANLTYAKKI